MNNQSQPIVRCGENKYSVAVTDAFYALCVRGDYFPQSGALFHPASQRRPNRRHWYHRQAVTDQPQKRKCYPSPPK
jgi:hypothetical protein